MSESFKSGFIAIIGRPNVGKSTLLNHVIGQKIAIMSDKPQTTRNKIQGILTTDKSQIIFIDTPGIHKPKHRLGDFMVKLAKDTLNEVDAILFMINATEDYGPGDEYIVELLKDIQKPVYLIINKIDLIHPDDIFSIISTYKDLHNFEEIIPVSALYGNNINPLLEKLEERLPEGPQYYSEEDVTDHPERFIMRELIREKVLHHTREEIPHSVAVVIDDLQKRKNGTVYIQSTIITERPTQKGIIIGKRGNVLKQIGKEARQDIEKLLGTKVFLELWVRVQKDWRNKETQLRELGFHEDDY